MIRGVDFKLSATNAAGGAFKSFVGGLNSIRDANKSARDSMSAFAAEADRLRAKFNPAAEAAARFEREVRELNRAQAMGVIDATQYGMQHKILTDKMRAASSAVTHHTAVVNQNNTAMVLAANSGMRSWNAGLNANRRAVQQFGFQMSDFAIQIAGGQSAMLAFTQQGGQMLQFFGPAGAILAALVAVFGSLFIGITRSGVAIDQLYPYLGALEDEFRGLVSSIGSVLSVFADLARFMLTNLDVIIIAVSLLVGWFGIRWVASMVLASKASAVFITWLRAMAVTYALLGVRATAAAAATSIFTGALGLLRRAIVLLGFPALVIAAAWLIERFMTLARGAGGFGAALGILRDVAAESFASMGLIVQLLYNEFQIMMNNVSYAFVNWIGGLKVKVGNFVDWFRENVNGILGTSLPTNVADKALEGTADAMDSLTDSLVVLLARNDELRTSISQSVPSLQRLKDALAAGEVNSPLPVFGGKPGDESAGGGGPDTGGLADQLKKLKDAAEETKKIFDDMSKSISSSLLEGFKALTQQSKSFAEVAFDILSNVANQIIDLLMSPIFDVVAKSVTGGILSGLTGLGAGSFGMGGGGGGSAFGGFGTSIPSFAGGGTTPSGPRAGGVDGSGGMLAILHPDETVTDHKRGRAAGGGDMHITFNITTPDVKGFRDSQSQIEAQIARAAAAGRRGN